MKHWLRAVAGFLATALGLALVGGLVMNWIVKSSCGDKCYELAEFSPAPDAQAIMVLGAAVYPGPRPSPMLQQRLDTAIAVWKMNPELPIIMSGDANGGSGNETEVMARYAVSAGVPKARIFIDGKGVSTYYSLARAVNTFKATNLIVVTQDYHLPRALYLAQSLRVDAVGVISPGREEGQLGRDIREVGARVKAWIYAQIQPQSEADGPYDLRGDGQVTAPASTYR
ncbi:SanA/YdcF family protein [Boudabousia marimammalium]|uniref:DUF218 domain-containing protein n=1 Tax=Boudabousia marimammalium TaxID=156892 RepID=A0A1Q5PRM2_9ACTO|nr:YdcF family protein [Boudabousia marimammalium]OKL50139.1 hypothetical protein BM477_01700 [Boudabousia marimammalium]